MSISIGTSFGPVRVSKRLGGKSRPRASVSAQDFADAGHALAEGGRGLVSFLRLALAVLVSGYWAVVAVSLALNFVVLAVIGFGLSKLVPGTYDWAMRFVKAARWSWLSVRRVFAKVWGQR